MTLSWTTVQWEPTQYFHVCFRNKRSAELQTALEISKIAPRHETTFIIMLICISKQMFCTQGNCIIQCTKWKTILLNRLAFSMLTYILYTISIKYNTSHIIRCQPTCSATRRSFWEAAVQQRKSSVSLTCSDHLCEGRTPVKTTFQTLLDAKINHF